MALFYPATFGIVGQKMTSLQLRSQGDAQDPHDEHYLLSTQSKQDQVRTAMASSLFGVVLSFFTHSVNQSVSQSHSQSHNHSMGLSHMYLYIHTHSDMHTSTVHIIHATF